MSSKLTPPLVEGGEEARFKLVDFLPTFLILTVLAALVASGAPRRTPNLGALQALFNKPKWDYIGLLAFAALVLSLLLQPFQLQIVRVLEGYWGDSTIADHLFWIGVEIQRRKLAALKRRRRLIKKDEANFSIAFRLNSRIKGYPAEHRLLPTTLGNALRSTEDLAGQRYGLKAVVVWPRLYPFIAEPLRAQIAHFRDQYSRGARLSVGFVTASFITAIVLLPNGGWWRLFPATGILLSWISYRSAVTAARLHGVVVMSAFDLYRLDLLKGLHVELPRTPREERVMNEAISAFFDQPEDLPGFPVARFDHRPLRPI